METIFRDLEQQIESFKKDTQLNCIAGCGFCCTKPDIEATVIEFLPLAYYYFITHQAWEKLVHLKEYPQSTCIVFQQGHQKDAGFCTSYQYRGLICRLFGFSARKNKHGENEFTTCKKIKEKEPQKFIDAYLKVKNGTKAPIMGQYYLRLIKVDLEAAHKFYPVNIAIQKAIEMVLAYYSYRRYVAVP